MLKKTKLGIERIFVWLLLFVPISLYFAYFTTLTTVAFITSILAIISLSRVIGYATKEIVLQSNPAFGGLINATFGNVVELFISYIALSKGLLILVKASIIGSIVGNILLLTGLAIFIGGIRFKEQKFNKTSIGVSSTMLIIAVVGLVIPTMYSLTSNTTDAQTDILSNSVAIVLAITYIASIIFAFFTHKHLFDASDEIVATKEKPSITKKMAGLILFITTIIVAVESNILVINVEDAAHVLGWTQTFVGVVVIAIITNIAEKATAIHFSLKNNIDLALEIGLSSAIQIALFVVPILVLISQIFGFGFSLVFSFFEIIALFLAVMLVNYLSADGKCNWLEGAQMISVYLIIAIAFFFI